MREICELFKLPFSTEAEVRRDGIDVRRFYESADYSAAVKAYPALYERFVGYLRANGIAGNIAADGSLLSRRIPEPDPRIMDELDGRDLYSEPKDALLDLLFGLGEKAVRGDTTARLGYALDGQIPGEVALDLERAVKTCGQLMFDAHLQALKS